MAGRRHLEPFLEDAGHHMVKATPQQLSESVASLVAERVPAVHEWLMEQ